METGRVETTHDRSEFHSLATGLHFGLSGECCGTYDCFNMDPCIQTWNDSRDNQEQNEGLCAAKWTMRRVEYQSVWKEGNEEPGHEENKNGSIEGILILLGGTSTTD